MSAPSFGVVPVVPRAGLDPSFVPPPGARCLSEDARVFELAGVIYRPTAPWTPAVHALLGHLETVGFDGAPRLIGNGVDDAGRQQLEFIDGELVHPYAWSDDAVVEVATLLRGLHDATA